MRPHRALVMPRTHALLSRYKAVRLVSITACHSSSFIRMMMLSWVIPALLTSTNGSPRSALMSANKASMLVASVTLSTRPRPSRDNRASLIVSAPCSEVAVPTTINPASASTPAIAAPIPRLAPVTKATLRDSSLTPCTPLLYWSAPRDPPRRCN